MGKKELLILIRKGSVSFLQKRDNYELLTLDGLNQHTYSNPDVDIPVLLNRIADKLNLESTASLSVSLLPAGSSTPVQPIAKAIREKTACPECRELDHLTALNGVIKYLEQDKTLEIDTFGVNFGASNYKIVGGNIAESCYNLLAYTVSEEQLVKHITD